MKSFLRWAAILGNTAAVALMLSVISAPSRSFKMSADETLTACVLIAAFAMAALLNIRVTQKVAGFGDRIFLATVVLCNFLLLALMGVQLIVEQFDVRDTVAQVSIAALCILNVSLLWSRDRSLKWPVTIAIVLLMAGGVYLIALQLLPMRCEMILDDVTACRHKSLKEALNEFWSSGRITDDSGRSWPKWDINRGTPPDEGVNSMPDAPQKETEQPREQGAAVSTTTLASAREGVSTARTYSGWKTYSNQNFSFSFKYPLDLVLARNQEVTGNPSFVDVDLDAGPARMWHMQVSKRNPSRLPTREFYAATQPERKLETFAVMNGIEVVWAPSLNGMRLNFTNGELFFNIEARGMERDDALRLLESFSFGPQPASADEGKAVSGCIRPVSPLFGQSYISDGEYQGWTHVSVIRYLFEFKHTSSMRVSPVSMECIVPGGGVAYGEMSIGGKWEEVSTSTLSIMIGFSNGNPAKLAVRELMDRFNPPGSVVPYKHYGTISGVEALELDDSGEARHLFFTRGEMVFNITARGMADGQLETFLGTFFVR